MAEWIFKKVKSSLSRIWNKQLLTFALFFAISSLFWLFVTLNENIREELSLPIKLINVPENVVITTELPTDIQVSAIGKGGTMLLYKFKNDRQTIIIDFKAFANNTGRIVVSSTEILKQVAAALPSGLQVIDVRPKQIECYYNYGEKKRVPVRLLGELKANTNFFVTQVINKPDSVTVFARKEILDTITAAYTTPLFLHNLADTTHTSIAFQHIRGAKFVPAKAGITIIADRLVEKTVAVPVQQVNFPATKVLRTFPASVNITFQVGMSQYRNITADNFVIVLHYEDLLLSSSSHYRLSLKSLPPGVRNARISPEEVEYVIEDIPSE